MTTNERWPDYARVHVYKSRTADRWHWEVGDNGDGWPFRYGTAETFEDAIRVGCGVHAEVTA